MPDIELLKWAATQGAWGMAFFVVVYMYRRDHLRKQEVLRAGHERRDIREDRLLAIIERHASAAEKLVSTIQELDKTLTEHHRFAAAWTERLARDVGEIGHDVKNILNRELGRGPR